MEYTLLYCLVSAVISGVSVYLLMRPREFLAAGSADTYKAAWDQLLSDHGQTVKFLTESSDAMLGVAGAMTNNMSLLLDRQSAVISRDYGQQALDLVKTLLDREEIRNLAKESRDRAREYAAFEAAALSPEADIEFAKPPPRVVPAHIPPTSL